MKHSAIHAIESRYSCRSYNNTALIEEVKSQLLEYMGHNKGGSFGPESRFKIGSYKSTGALLKRLITYDFIRDTDELLIGAKTGKWLVDDPKISLPDEHRVPGKLDAGLTVIVLKIEQSICIIQYIDPTRSIFYRSCLSFSYCSNIERFSESSSLDSFRPSKKR